MATHNRREKSGRNKRTAKREPHPVKRFFKILGPGLVTGASDDDPSGIGTYAMAGASLGYAVLWTAWITFPLTAAIQFVCAKVGLVTGKGLAGVLKQHYSRKLLYPVVLGLLIANIINAGADIGAIAAGLNLLMPVPIPLWILPIGFSLVVLEIWGSYRLIANTFKWLTLALFAYIGSSFLAKPDWGEVLKGTLIPTLHFDRNFLTILVAILGTTISPYLFFWQTSQEVEEQIAMGRTRLWQRQGATARELKDAAWDVDVGMLFSNVVMYFIILATAATLHRTGQTHIDTAAQAAEALRPLTGQAAYILMALGLIGSGLLAVPILTTSGAYAVCETFGWEWGLDKKLRGGKHFYLVIGASTIAALFIDYLGIKPMSMLLWSAVINGFLAPPLMLLIMLIGNNPKIMGKRVNGLTVNVLGWAATALMVMAVIGLVSSWRK